MGAKGPRKGPKALFQERKARIEEQSAGNNANYFGNESSGRHLDDDTASKRKLSPKASAWDQLRNQSIDERYDTRDVHGNQTIQRGEMGDIRGPGMARLVTVLTGVLTLLLVWFAWGMLGYAFQTVSDKMGSANDPMMEYTQSLGVPPYYVTDSQTVGESPISSTCYQPVSPEGKPIGECLSSPPGEPEWHVYMVDEALTAQGLDRSDLPSPADDSFVGWIFFSHVSIWRILVTLMAAFGVGASVRTVAMRKLESENVMYDHSDINQYSGDQHIALTQEVVGKYQIFPDVGATSPVLVSSMLSHVMLSNNKVKKVKVSRFADADIIDEDGNVVAYKGALLRDDDGNVKYDTKPMFDAEFAHFLWDNSDLPNDKKLRLFVDPSKVPSNPGGKIYDKFGDAATLAEHINKYWELPEYEPRRPAGAYIIDEAPVNTMILAMTRAGKGQTYIEPVIDMWLRESRPNNMVINDPKGELLVKHYVRASVRGYQVIQFNLINSLKTDIYNPLALAAEAAREGDYNMCAQYVGGIADVFFPSDSGDDPVWANAANNAFKRTAYGMIDYYLEEEREMRIRAVNEGWDAKVLDTRIDNMWGRVTLYNCYQFFVRLSSKRLKDPVAQLSEKIKDLEPEEQNKYLEEWKRADAEKELWDGDDEIDMLTLFFNATDRLPANSMRNLVGNADKSLRAMGAAEKMLASCDVFCGEKPQHAYVGV